MCVDRFGNTAILHSGTIGTSTRSRCSSFSNESTKAKVPSSRRHNVRGYKIPKYINEISSGIKSCLVSIAKVSSFRSHRRRCNFIEKGVSFETKLTKDEEGRRERDINGKRSTLKPSSDFRVAIISLFEIPLVFERSRAFERSNYGENRERRSGIAGTIDHSRTTIQLACRARLF
jgi:hypothetical protein